MLPAEPSFLDYFRKTKTNLPLRPSPGLITWQFIHQKVPWSLILLMGAAFAFVEANRCFGLSLVMASDLVRFVYWPPLITMLIFCATAQCLTTFIPNVAAAAILRDPRTLNRSSSLMLFSLPIGPQSRTQSSEQIDSSFVELFYGLSLANGNAAQLHCGRNRTHQNKGYGCCRNQSFPYHLVHRVGYDAYVGHHCLPRTGNLSRVDTVSTSQLSLFCCLILVIVNILFDLTP